MGKRKREEEEGSSGCNFINSLLGTRSACSETRDPELDCNSPADVGLPGI